MCGLNARRAFANALKQLGAEEAHSTCRQFVRALVVARVLPDGLKISAKDKVRRIDKENMVAGANGLCHVVNLLALVFLEADNNARKPLYQRKRAA